MTWLIKTEKALFYFLSFAGFWQLRLVWAPVGRQFNEWISFFLYATDFIIVAVLFLWLWRRLVRKKTENTNPPQPSLKGGRENGSPPLGGVRGDFLYRDLFLLIFLIFCALSLFVASDKTLGLYRLVKLLEFIGLYFYVRYNFAELYSLKRFWQWFIAGATLQSVVAIWQFLAQQSLGLKFFAESPLSPSLDGVAKIAVNGEKIIRAYGLVPHPNILAAILTIAIFGLVWLWLEKDRECHPGLDPGSRSWIPAFAGMTKKYDLWRAFVYTLILILLSVALFVTFSRGVIIVGGVLFLIWLAHLWRNNKEYRKLIIFVCILLFTVNCLLLTIYWPYISSRYDLVALAGSQSVNLRSFYNQEAIKMIWQKPLLGVGFGNFVPALKQAVSLSDWQYQPAHNIYLLAAAENGLPALLAFLAFLFLTLRSAWPCRKNLSVNCLLFTVCCLLFLGLFDHFLWDLQQGQILFWLMLGLLASFSPRS